MNANKRKSNAKQVKPCAKRSQDNAFLQYNGGCRDYEDIADYLPRISLKSVVIA